MPMTDTQIADGIRGKIRHTVGWLRIWMGSGGVPADRIEQIKPEHVDAAAAALLGPLGIEQQLTGHPWDKRRGYVRGKKAKQAAGE